MNLKAVLKSQYHAALAMLRDAIDRCPDEEWLNRDHKNAFWQVAYHVLFFTHLYLQPNEAAFRVWTQHRGADDGTTGDPYTKAQVIEYWSFVDQMVDSAVDSLDLEIQRVGSGGTRCRSSSISLSTCATFSIMARSWPIASVRPPTSALNG